MSIHKVHSHVHDAAFGMLSSRVGSPCLSTTSSERQSSAGRYNGPWKAAAWTFLLVILLKDACFSVAIKPQAARTNLGVSQDSPALKGLTVTSPAVTAGGCRCKNVAYASTTYRGQYQHSHLGQCFVSYPDPPLSFTPLLPICIVDPKTCTGYAPLQHSEGYYYDYCVPDMRPPTTESGCRCRPSYSVFDEPSSMWYGVVGCISTMGRPGKTWCIVEPGSCVEGAELPGADWDWCTSSRALFDTTAYSVATAVAHFAMNVDESMGLSMVRIYALQNPLWLREQTMVTWSTTCNLDSSQQCWEWFDVNTYVVASYGRLDSVNVAQRYTSILTCLNCSQYSGAYPGVDFDPHNKEAVAAVPRFQQEGADNMFVHTAHRGRISCSLYFCPFVSLKPANVEKLDELCTEPMVSHWLEGLLPPDVFINMEVIVRQDIHLAHLKMSSESMLLRCQCHNMDDCAAALSDTQLQLYREPWTAVRDVHPPPLASFKFVDAASCWQGTNSCVLMPTGINTHLWHQALTVRYAISNSCTLVKDVNYIPVIAAPQNPTPVRRIRSLSSAWTSYAKWGIPWLLVAVCLVAVGAAYTTLGWTTLRRATYNSVSSSICSGAAPGKTHCTPSAENSGVVAVSSIDVKPPLFDLPRNFSWMLDAEEVRVVTKPDGSPWLLGSGGFGKVYKGQWKGSMPVAIKVLDCTSMTERDKRNTQKEVSILRSCRSPYVVQFLGASFQDDRVLIMTELMAGGDLHTAIGNGVVTWHKKGGTIALDAARGVHYLHQHNVLHLDIKSANILLTQFGAAKVGDVGLAHILASHYATQGQVMIGTWAWMAPEVLIGSSVTLSADVYSFGIVLWEIMTGEQPKRGMLRRPTAEEGPEEVADLIDQCTEFDPKARPTMQDVLVILEKLVDEARKQRLELMMKKAGDAAT